MPRMKVSSYVCLFQPLNTNFSVVPPLNPCPNSLLNSLDPGHGGMLLHPHLRGLSLPLCFTFKPASVISPQWHFLEHFYVQVFSTDALSETLCYCGLFSALFSNHTIPCLSNILFLIFSMLSSISDVPSFWVTYHILSALS